MNTPLVSVVVPCYNDGQYLSEALQSVFNQTYKNWECIIVNDGSTDNSTEIAKKWLSIDSRFSYIEIENSGVCKARNVGIDRAKGDYILPLDADDKISKDYLYLGIKAFLDNNALYVVYSEAEFFGNKKGLLKLKEFSLENLARNNMIFCSAFFRREDCLSIGKYDLNLRDGLEDWEFWINLLKEGGKVHKIPKVCFYYRKIEGTRNVSITTSQYKVIYDYISLKHAAFFIKHLGSFIELEKKYNKLEKKHIKLTTHKKLVLNTFCKTFFGFNFLKRK